MDLSKIAHRVRNKRVKRLGRGVGSGRGKRSGRGDKGAGSRKGKKLPYIGFNGGNIPLARKLPKRGFTSPATKEFQIVNLDDINKRLKEASEVTPEALKKVNLIKDTDALIKVLGKCEGTFGLKVVVKADAFSKSAKLAIETAGGKVEIRK